MSEFCKHNIHESHYCGDCHKEILSFVKIEGWNDAIEAARKVVLDTVIPNKELNILECTKTPYEIADEIGKLRRK
jgi:hypothetical protein